MKVKPQIIPLHPTSKQIQFSSFMGWQYVGDGVSIKWIIIRGDDIGCFTESGWSLLT